MGGGRLHGDGCLLRTPRCIYVSVVLLVESDVHVPVLYMYALSHECLSVCLPPVGGTEACCAEGCSLWG